jgi:hypothetical protein
MPKARKRKRVHRVARGKPKPGHIVAHNRRRRKGEILCHNHVLHTAATANGVHGFRWFTVCAPAGWDPASEEWEVCPCGWRPELRSTTPRPAMCNGGASKLKSAEVLRLSTVRSVGASASTATWTWDNQHVGLSVRFDEHVATNFAQSLLNPIFRFVGGRLIEVR